MAEMQARGPRSSNHREGHEFDPCRLRPKNNHREGHEFHSCRFRPKRDLRLPAAEGMFALHDSTPRETSFLTYRPAIGTSRTRALPAPDDPSKQRLPADLEGFNFRSES